MLNLTLSSLHIHHLDKSPLFVGNNIKANNLRAKYIVSPIFYNQRNLLISKAVFSNSLSPAIYSILTFGNKTFYPINYTTKYPNQITITRGSFSNFTSTAVIADSNSHPDSNILFSKCFFVGCRSNFSGGCIFLRFGTANISTTCCDSCSSNDRGHFLYAEDTHIPVFYCTSIYRSPDESPHPSTIYAIQRNQMIEKDSHTVNYLNSTNGHVYQYNSVMYVYNTIFHINYMQAVNNSGNTIAFFDQIRQSVIQYAVFAYNTNHETSVIKLRHLSRVRLAPNLILYKNGPKSFDIDLTESLSDIFISGKVDEPAETESDVKINSKFKLFSKTNISTLEFDITLDMDCIITPRYKFSNNIKISIGLISTINIVVLVVCVFFILKDVKNWIKMNNEEGSSIPAMKP
ncbi:hypothetical protein TVAG_496770 [Trichomonas vaginalis G3]|uniref:Transmembrane protein n=1 Tax=Trichomonas vaginalis (strain ATCC PRA-98 / G3) TaxID=412133 RepID=A2FP14_TRIV3|nr:hypothetical protein TVAGG3_0514270 [Trichomonas vaginalis G3]EAX93355.1 hypothetical protein TVAG_496770 [Trichomonas vaginalis G3]KAI5518002.1 hypothetical protein TVAGG3_0514270 [Trichomonas vaginalis G3]|eukprot:XP_001306285.1 hypothetical protein [Trichomonas vaginalis G3]